MQKGTPIALAGFALIALALAYAMLGDVPAPGPPGRFRDEPIPVPEYPDTVDWAEPPPPEAPPDAPRPDPSEFPSDRPVIIPPLRDEGPAPARKLPPVDPDDPASAAEGVPL